MFQACELKRIRFMSMIHIFKRAAFVAAACSAFVSGPSFALPTIAHETPRQTANRNFAIRVLFPADATTAATKNSCYRLQHQPQKEACLTQDVISLSTKESIVCIRYVLRYPGPPQRLSKEDAFCFDMANRRTHYTFPSYLLHSLKTPLTMHS